MSVELDYFEYSTDALAQAAYVTNAANISQYPEQQSDTYVKATSQNAPDLAPYYATDPAASLIGSGSYGSWAAGDDQYTNQRFHIDLGSAKVVERIYYENGHHLGGYTGRGAKNFTLWGSNTAGDFADLVYANNGTWVAIIR